MQKNGLIPPQVDIDEIARKGSAIYKRIKDQYEPVNNGKYLAINPESGETYMADHGADAVEAGRNAHPNVIFYLVKIGYEAVDTLASLYSHV